MGIWSTRVVSGCMENKALLHWVLAKAMWVGDGICGICSRKSGPFLAWDTLMCGKRENMKASSWGIQKFDAPECSPLGIEKISWMVVKPAVDGLLPCCSPNVFLNAILRVSLGTTRNHKMTTSIYFGDFPTMDGTPPQVRCDGTVELLRVSRVTKRRGMGIFQAPKNRWRSPMG